VCRWKRDKRGGECGHRGIVRWCSDKRLYHGVQGNYHLYRSCCSLDEHEAIGKYARSGEQMQDWVVRSSTIF
jgi:hypothetical protein